MSNRTVIGFGLACVLVFVAMVAANLSTARFIETGAWTLKIYELRSQSDHLLTHFLGAQSYLRSYHLTKHDFFLDLHKDFRGEMVQALDKLRALAADHPESKSHIEKTEGLLKARLQAWDDSFKVYKISGAELLRSDLMKTENQERDAGILSTVAELQGSIDKALSRNIEAAHIEGRRARVVMWLGGLSACALIMITTLTAMRDNRRRREAEAEMDNFFDISLDLLCISGMDGYFKRLSPSYSDTLGYSLKELYSRPVVDFVHPEDVQKTADEIASQAAGNKVMSFENRFRHKDGTYRTFSWKSVPVGERMYAVARDVTQQKEFESQLMRAREAAQAATVAKAAFLANMSHEIRTPLNGVVGMADLLARTQMEPQQKSYVETIRNSAAILLKIINEILDFSKIEAGRMPVEMADFDLVQLVESRVSLIGIMASEKGLKIDANVEPGLPRLWHGDSGKIGQILTNLMNNSFKFTDKGFVRIDVRLIERTGDGGTVEFAVTDSGIGMSEKVMKSLFEPFMQAEKSSPSKWGGTGLGLSICRRLVEMMGGQIGVESKPGEGSRFWFRLPLAFSTVKELPEEETRKKSTEPTAEQKARRKAIRILVAEDNRTNQAVVTGMLTALGYSSTIAKNGQEAVEKFAKENYHIVLMDQHMPVMDGLEATRHIRATERGASVPIIAFTANVPQEEQKNLYADLMDDFVLKPVLLDTLDTVLSRWEAKLEGSNRLRE